MSKAIFSDVDLTNFKNSLTYNEFFKFIKVCSEHVNDAQNTESIKVERIMMFLDKLIVTVEEIPPIKQPMRFGNKAFRIWHDRLCQVEVPLFLRELLDEQLYAKHHVELAAHLNGSFGNEVRMDYGTGHETNFVIFLFCLYKCKILNSNDLNIIVLIIFRKYLKLMRKLQDVYVLEPAGSHGVWGLDDYHCLLFVWGSAQVSIV